MNRRNGNYVIPPEIRALAPHGVPCRIEAQCYVPKKNNPTGTTVIVRYYVYEERSPKNAAPPQGGKPNGRTLLGKIMGGQFIPNKKGAERIAELTKPEGTRQKEEPQETVKALESLKDVEVPDSPGYIPKVKDIDPQIKNYGEYATVLASTKDVLANLQKVFNTEDAIRLYTLGIIYFIEEYTPASYCADIFNQSVLSNKWPTLAFSENTINSFLKDVGRAGLFCEQYSQRLITNSSGLTAIDGHVIVSSSKQNELAEFGYKYHELNDKQINVMGAYDAENNRQLISKAMAGSLPDKLSVKELFDAYKFEKKTFLCDSGFYSEENIGLFRQNEGHFVMPIPDHNSISKMIRSDMKFEDSFAYEHLEDDGTTTMRTILYKESTVAELEALDDEYKKQAAEEKTAEAATKAQEGTKPKKYYPQYNQKSEWGNDRVIMYRDKVMHDRLVYDYRIQIGRDKKHTEEDFARREPGFGVIVLRTNYSKEKADAKQIYLWYKKRWTIETHYNFVANIVKYDGLQTQDYYSMQGLGFLILIVGQIKADYVSKLRSGEGAYVRNMSIKESLVKAGFVKISLHQDKRWYVSIMNQKVLDLLTTMGVSIEDDINKLNNKCY